MASFLRSALVVLISAMHVMPSYSTIFDGYELLKVTPGNLEQVKYLREQEATFHGLDFWQHPAENAECRILVSPGLAPFFKEALETQGISYVVDSTDIEPLVINSNAVDADGVDPADDFHTKYHDYVEIKDYIDQLVDQYKFNIVRNSLPFLTFEGEEVMLVKMYGRLTATRKPAIVIAGGIDAREWLCPASIVYAIEKILRDYNHPDPTPTRQMLDKFDLYIIPVTNPDGYIHTHKSNSTRLWRKNRHVVNGCCTGVDISRNFDAHFETELTDGRNNLFPGVSPFSEAESSNIKELFNHLGGSVIAYLSVHAYSQSLIVPFSYADRPSKPYGVDRDIFVALKMAQGIKDVHDKIYKVGNQWELFQYPSGGSPIDWAASKIPDITSLRFELRPSSDSDFAFLLPPPEIIPTGQEFLASLQAMTKELKKFV